MELSREIMKQLSMKGELQNFVFSPLSIHILLSIVASGQKSAPNLDHLLSLLGFETLADLHAHVSNNQLNNTHFSLSKNPRGPILSSFNGAWVDKKFTFNPSFRRLLQTLFHAKPATVDFENQAEESIKEINSWWKKATKGLIKNFLNPYNYAEKKELVLILANALYFKGAWLDPFDEFRTKYDDFYTLNGEKVVVSYMRKLYESFPYAASMGFKILSMPYLNDDRLRNAGESRRFSMYIFLPDDKDGLLKLLDRFGSSPDLLNLQFEFQTVDIRELKIPRFKFKCRYEVSKFMKLLGLEMNLKDAEILEGLYEYVPMKNSKIIHNCSIDVNESGTEAAAIMDDDEKTGFSLDSSPPLDFIADRSQGLMSFLELCLIKYYHNDLFVTKFTKILSLFLIR